MEDILVIGESLVDIVIPPGGEPAEHPGGSPANVALGLARLDHDVRLLTRFGTDERGDTIAAWLSEAGVTIADGSVVAAPTSTAAAYLNPSGVARYEFDLIWALPDDLTIGDPAAVHTGSIGAAVEPGCDTVAALIEKVAGRSVISYDPNARPHLMGSPDAALGRMMRMIRLADVVKVSDEDLEWLTPGQDPLAVAQQWQAEGPALVVVTRGPHGASGVLAGGVVDVGAPPIVVADTVGAGDAFMSGLLDALATTGLLEPQGRDRLHRLAPASLGPLLSHAVKTAAFTCTQPGANPPTRQQLGDWKPGSANQP